MRIEIKLWPNVLAAMKLFTTDKDPRAHLNALFFEVSAQQTLIVAANGYALGVYRLALPQPSLQGEQNVQAIIPMSAFNFCKLKGTDIEVVLEYDQADPSMIDVTVDQSGVSTNTRAMIAEYPRFRQAILRETSGETAQYNSMMLALFGRAAGILKGKPAETPLVCIRYNGEKAARVHLLSAPDFVGAILPLRYTEDALRHSAFPEWL